MPTPSQLRTLHRAFVTTSARGPATPTLLALTTPLYELVQPFHPRLPLGRAGLTAALSLFHSIFQPIDVEVLEEVADGSRCLTALRVFARHVGRLGPLRATGRKTLFEALIWSEFDGDRVARSWVEANAGSVLGDLEALEPPAEGAAP